MDEARSYPLHWPDAWMRTPPHKRAPSAFKMKVHRLGGAMQPIDFQTARDRLAGELDKIGATYVVLSTNLDLRIDGQPRAGATTPEDPGAAVWFRLKGKPTCMPCDKYTTVAGNIAAIAAHIEFTRGIERHGVATLDQMFTHFQALRGPGKKHWREILGIAEDEPVTMELVKARRNQLAKQHHTDLGGDHAIMAEINAAADEAFQELQ